MNVLSQLSISGRTLNYYQLGLNVKREEIGLTIFLKDWINNIQEVDQVDPGSELGCHLMLITKR